MADNDETIEERLVTAEEIARLDAIFDKRRKIGTDEDLLELAKLVDEEE